MLGMVGHSWRENDYVVNEKSHERAVFEYGSEESGHMCWDNLDTELGSSEDVLDVAPGES